MTDARRLGGASGRSVEQPRGVMVGVQKKHEQDLNAMLRADDGKAEGIRKAYEKIIDWEDLDATERAAVILVAEGVKPATEIVAFDIPEAVREELGLSFRGHMLSNHMQIFEVSKDPYIAGKLAAGRLERTNQYLADTGLMYGFPDCCIDSFVAGHEWQEFKEEVRASDATIRGKIEPLLPFTYFVPCSTSCEAFIAQAKLYKATLERVAPRLVRELETRVRH